MKLRLHALELSSLFLGATRDITLLEADATLIGLNRKSNTDVIETLDSAVGKAVASVSS